MNIYLGKLHLDTLSPLNNRHFLGMLNHPHLLRKKIQYFSVSFYKYSYCRLVKIICDLFLELFSRSHLFLNNTLQYCQGSRKEPVLVMSIFVRYNHQNGYS